MKKGDLIKGYRLLQDFVVIGGQSKITFAEKDGKQYFIKEFLSPKYPVDGAPGSTRTIHQKRQKCKVFEEHHQCINTKIAEKVAFGGNLVFAVDFFREGTTYYKINEKIDVASITPREISELRMDQKILICKTVCHSLKILHSLDIVHGDIKPDNVLIKKTATGSFTSKLIDFDNSYFSTKPPVNEEEVIGDQVYYAPEMAKYILKHGDTNSYDLTLKVDVFALGVLFTEYLLGKHPEFSDEYSYLWESLLNGEELKMIYPKSFPKSLAQLLDKMLSKDYNDRPPLHEVFDQLKTYKKSKEAESRKESDTAGGLTGKLFEKIKPEKKNPFGGKLKGGLIKKKKY